jgi:hypothetical protein
MRSNFNRKDKLEKPSKMTAAAMLVVMIITSALMVTLSQAFAQQAAPGSVLKLSRASVPIDIPLMKGYENGNDIFFIGTDVSDKQAADQLTEMTNFTVNVAPILSQTPESARGQIYVFTNGIPGKGPNGFQLPVLNANPGNESYSPLAQVNMVTWNNTGADLSPGKELKSVQEIMSAQKSGQLTIQKTDIIANHPGVKWEGGSMKIRDDKKINDDSKYVGGQVLNIDTDKLIVTMLAHRGWGPDGKTVYYIVTDATPEMPASMMGVTSVPLDEKLASTPVAVNLLQFMNGINGTGPMGFQAGIGDSNPTDKNYSPMWKISFIEWKDPSQARVLETLDDILAMQKAGTITVTAAMEGKHVVNCPFFDQSTVFEHENKAYYSS